MTSREQDRRRRVLFTMLTTLDYRYPPGREPALIAALRTWLHGWPGIGRIVARMSRWGHDLQLARHGTEGCGGRSSETGWAANGRALVGAPCGVRCDARDSGRRSDVCLHAPARGFTGGDRERRGSRRLRAVSVVVIGAIMETRSAR